MSERDGQQPHRRGTYLRTEVQAVSERIYIGRRAMCPDSSEDYACRLATSRATISQLNYAYRHACFMYRFPQNADPREEFESIGPEISMGVSCLVSLMSWMSESALPAT
jgi:hypothetical protein